METSRINPSKEDIENFKKACNKSRIKTYTNGYEAHWIDEHPHGSMYRKLDNPSGLLAFPEEKIMVVIASTNTVVVFLERLSNLDEFEKSMHLVGYNNNTRYAQNLK